MMKRIIVITELLFFLIPAMIFAGVIDVTKPPYNADNTGQLDAAPAIQSAFDSGAAKIYFPAGSYKINSALNLCTGNTSNTIIYGDGVNKTFLKASSNITILTAANGTILRDISFRQTSTSREGIGIYMQASIFCEFNNVSVNGFNKGILMKQGIWSSYRNITVRNNNIGIELTGDSPQWNDYTCGGWYINQISFDNILCEGGEVGIKAVCMGVTFNNVTTQGQQDKGAGNVPTGKGTGIWTEGITSTGLGKARNNVIMNHYAESTQRPIFIKDAINTVVIGAFAQGGYPTPYPCWLEAENTTVDIVGGINGLNRFTVSAVLNNATLYGDCRASFDVSCTNYVTLNNESKYKQGGRALAQNDNFIFSMSGAGTKEINYSFKNFHHYRVCVGGLYDGYLPRLACFKVFRFNSNNLTKIITDPGNSGDISLSSVNNKPVVSVSGSMAYSLYVTIEDVSAMCGKFSDSQTKTY